MNDKVKIIVAAVCLGIAGLAIAFQMGVFGGSKAPQGATSNNNYDDEVEAIQNNPNANNGAPVIIEPEEGAGGRSGIVGG